MDYYTLLKEFIAVLMEAVIMILIYLRVFEKNYYLKEEKSKVIFFILMYAVFSTWASLSIPQGYHSIIIMIFSTMILSILTSTKFLKSFIAVVVGLIYFTIVDLLTISVISLITGDDLFDSIKLESIKYQVTFTAKFIQIFIVLMIYKYNKRIIKFKSNDEDENVLGYWFLGMFLMALFITVGISNKKDVYLYQALLFAFFFLFIVVGMIDYKKKIELLQIKNKYHLKEEYINNLEAIVDIIRREKHDFANHINTVYAMCIMNRPDTLERIKAYLKSTTNNLESTYKFYDTGNGYVDGLIAVKSNFAFENNIYLDVDFETPLEVIAINDNDLIGIIGNVLDNALYAVFSEKEDGKKIVSVYGYMENERYYLSIANNGPMVPKEIGNKIFKKGFSTKSDNRRDHGFGLYIVDQLVKKNGGQIIFSSSPEETEFLIEFKVRKEYYGKIS